MRGKSATPRTSCITALTSSGLSLSTSLSGEFYIVDINLEGSYLLVKENDDKPAIRIYYDADNLMTRMQDLKTHLHSAIDNQHKRFAIKASVIRRDGKSDTIALINIEELRH